MNQNVIGLRRTVPALVAVALMLCVGCFIVADTEQTDAAGNWGNQTINGEIGNEVNIELNRVVGLPMSQRSDVIDEERTSDVFEKVGLTVTADFQARGLGGYENFVTITGTPTFHCDENFDIYNSNGDHWSGHITIKGVESITFDETEKHITYKGDDTETVTIIATVSPQDVQNKGIEWDVISGPGKIIESTVTETGSVCNVEVTGTGQIVVRATHQYNTAATEDCTIFSQEEVTIIPPINTEWKVDQEFTLTPMTDPADADIELNRVVFNGEEQDESYYGDFIYVDDRTVRATFPEAGTWEIFYSASASNYATNDGGQIRVIVTDQPVTGIPTVTGIIASPNLGHSMMFDFVAVNVTNMSTMTWDFGDGTIEPGAETVGHTYTQPGRYTVKVTVANDNGATATAETTIIVSGDEPSEEAWINVQYWWAYRIVGDAQQFSFDNSETPWLTASMQTDGEDRFIVISGTPTLTNGATVDEVYECKLTVNEGATVEAYAFAVSGNGDGKKDNTLITINGGKLVSEAGPAIYHPQYGKLVINGGTLDGCSGVEIRAGELMVNGGTIKGDTSQTIVYPKDQIGGGNSVDGGGIIVAQHSTKLPVKVTVTGGTIEANTAFIQHNVMGNDQASIDKIEMSITGGEFVGALRSDNFKDVDGKGFVSGGSFSDRAVGDYLAPGAAVAVNGGETPYDIFPSTDEALENGGAHTVVDRQGNTWVFADKDAASSFADESGSTVKTVTHTVTFDDCLPTTANTVVEVENGSPVARPTDPACEGWKFLGWYEFSNGSYAAEPYDFAAPVRSDLTLYAKWEQVDPEPEVEPQDPAAPETDAEKNDGGLAQTGDATSVAPLVASAMAGATALAAGAVTLRRRK